MREAVVFLAIVLAVPLGAQLGGPIGGDPFPKGPSEQNRQSTSRNPAKRVVSIRAMFRARDGEELFVEAEDKRVLIVRLTKTTEYWKGKGKVKSIDFEPGDQLVIDATEDENRKFLAVSIVFDRAGTDAQKAAARQPLEETAYHRAQNTSGTTPEPPKKSAAKKESPKKEEKEEPQAPEPPSTIQAVKAEDDPDRPRLARGRRAPSPSSAPEAVAEAVPPPPANRQTIAAPASKSVVVLDSSNEPDPFITRVREELEKYVGTLPNYMVKQYTTRYASSTAKTDWRALDHVTADLVCEDGKERYLNLSKKASESGAWSTGEFVTLLRDLFSYATAPEFRYRGSSWMQKRAARLYDFKVPQERSHWHIVTPGQRYFPAYKGSVWIDKETGRPLRIEMQARDIPEQFPLDSIESATDYDFVNIGGSSFLLPVKSDVLTCSRGTSDCSLNTIEFRNYKKFGAKSDITF